MKRILVTGASGFVGYNVCRFLSLDWGVHGISGSRPALHLPKGLGPRTSTILDIRNYEGIKDLLDRLMPDGVLHLAALAAPNACEADPVASRQINVDASVNLAGLCAKRGIRLLFTSTDMVFDGRDAPYGEDDPTSPLNVYGWHKVVAERGVLERHPGALVCRLPLLYGDPGPNSRSFLQDMLEWTREGRELPLFTDEFRTPLSGRDAALGLKLAFESGRTGILHLAGRERVSRYEFGEALAEFLGSEKVKLRPLRRKDADMAAKRPEDASLDGSEAFKLGFAPGTVREELKYFLERER